MTRLSERKRKLIVETSDCVRECGKLREVVLEGDGSGYLVYVRLKGLKTKYPISPAGIYNAAVKIEVERRRAEKRAKRKTR